MYCYWVKSGPYYQYFPIYLRRSETLHYSMGTPLVAPQVKSNRVVKKNAPPAGLRRGPKVPPGSSLLSYQRHVLSLVLSLQARPYTPSEIRCIERSEVRDFLSHRYQRCGRPDFS